MILYENAHSGFESFLSHTVVYKYYFILYSLTKRVNENFHSKN